MTRPRTPAPFAERPAPGAAPPLGRAQACLRENRPEAALALLEEARMAGLVDPAADRLAAIAGALAWDFEAAEAALARLQAAGEVIADCADFVADQRRAEERDEAFKALFRDSRRGARWATGRFSTLEIFAREERCAALFSDLFEMGRGMQRYAFNPESAARLLETLPARMEAIMEAARAEAPPLLFLSDSHSRCFEWLVYDGLVPQQVAGVCSVSQANIYGLTMPSRTVPTLRRFREALDAFPAHSVTVLHIGEVDCRAIYWNLREHMALERAGFVDAVARNFDRLLDEVTARTPRVVVTAPIRPSYRIRPEDEPGPARVDAEDILALTDAINQRLGNAAADRGLPFVSVNEVMAAFGSGLDNPYYRAIPDSPKITHHCHAPKVAGFWARALAPHLTGG